MRRISRAEDSSTPQASPGRVTRADRLREATTHYPPEVRDASRWVAYMGADHTVLPESNMVLADGASLADPSTWTDLAGAIDTANRNRSACGVAFVCGGGWVQARLTNPTSADIALGVMNEPCNDGTTDLRVLLQHPVEDDEVNPRWPNEPRLTTIRHLLWAVPVPLRLVGQVEPITAKELRDLVQLDPGWLPIMAEYDGIGSDTGKGNPDAAARLMFRLALAESDGSKADRAYFLDIVQQTMQLVGIDPPTKRALEATYAEVKSTLPTRVKQPSKAQKRAERAERVDGFVDDIDHAAALLREVEASGHLYLAAERVWLLRDSRTGLLHRATVDDGAGLYDYAVDWTRRHTELLDLGSRSALSHAHRIAHAVTTAQSIHTTLGDIDQHHDLVGTPDGVLDLRTGLVRRASDDERVTRCVSCSPAATYEGSAWIDWLQMVVPDATERTLLQNLIGYTLCGHRDGKLFAVLYGTAGSGKSTFLETLFRVFGDYASTVPLRSLYASEGDSALDYGYAALNGKRFAFADELDSRRTMAEDFVKALSTGASVTARRRFGHEQDVAATACLWMATNDLPRIRNGGEALVVRARLFAWHQVIEQPDIRERIYADLPAVLAWVVEGARRYMTDGPSCLSATDDMIDAAQEWLVDDAYNPMQRFVRECVQQREGGFVFASDLKDAYEVWRRGQDGRVDAAYTPKGLSDALNGLGLCKAGPNNPYPAKRTKRLDPRTVLQARGWTNLSVGYDPAPRTITPLDADETVDGLPV